MLLTLQPLLPCVSEQIAEVSLPPFSTIENHVEAP
jgi:hypothetical protein